MAWDAVPSTLPAIPAIFMVSDTVPSTLPAIPAIFIARDAIPSTLPDIPTLSMAGAAATVLYLPPYPASVEFLLMFILFCTFLFSPLQDIWS